MNKIEELQVLIEEHNNKVNKRTEKWINKQLIPFLEKMAKDGKYSVKCLDLEDLGRCFYAIDRILKCSYFKKDINIDLVRTRLKEMGFYIKSWYGDDNFEVYWDKEHTSSK